MGTGVQSGMWTVMHATRRGYSDCVCPYCFFAERLFYGCTLFQTGTQRGRMRRVKWLS